MITSEHKYSIDFFDNQQKNTFKGKIILDMILLRVYSIITNYL